MFFIQMISLSWSLCRFWVDFQCGNSQISRPDIAFHFNVRFDQNCIVCNSHEKGSWQQEERKYDMVFRTGHPFQIQFVVNSSSYVVQRRYVPFMDYNHHLFKIYLVWLLSFTLYTKLHLKCKINPSCGHKLMEFISLETISFTEKLIKSLTHFGYSIQSANGALPKTELGKKVALVTSQQGFKYCLDGLLLSDLL
uniref:Galectin n=1 Tax=Naja naja TaxID=35670 RepID=A0A8C6YB62_NAJNA